MGALAVFVLLMTRQPCSTAARAPPVAAQPASRLEDGGQHDPALGVLGAALLAVKELLQAPVLALRPDGHLVRARGGEEEPGHGLGGVGWCRVGACGW